MKIAGLSERTVFFILLGILLVPSIFFISQSYSQLRVILNDINTQPSLISTQILNKLSTHSQQEMPNFNVLLEIDVMKYRHKRTTAFLSTRTWMRFMSLIFGVILITIGSGFVLGKIKSQEIKSEFTFKDLGANIATSSPGIILVFCGVILIAIPNMSNQRIDTNDTSTYMSKLLDRDNNANHHKQSTLDDIRKRYNQSSLN
ncbi:MAG: hypothetical protein N0E54_06325 [Candidatus Thiodiazotropha taylori]|nr:hypothetical protein [Candidatus Thiodiazotropha endolucinida]MCW4228336.1 hypothetical protein [Candidatus Thiodiazotropha taylori]